MLIPKLRYFIKHPKTQCVIRFLVHFLKKAPLDGLQHLARPDIHLLEFLFWILSFVVSVILAIHCSIFVSDDYSHEFMKSTLIAKKDYLHFATALPAYTFCPHHIVDRYKAQEFLKTKLVPVKQHSKILQFLEELGKRTIFSDKIINEYNFPSWINTEVYMELIFNFSIEHKIMTENGERGVPVFTELGLCYTFNNMITKYISLDNWIDGKQINVAKNFSLETKIQPKISYRNIFPMTNIFTLENSSNIFDLYIHSTYEIPNIWTRKAAVINTSQFRDFIMTFTVMEIVMNEQHEFVSSDSEIQKRKCRKRLDSNLKMFPKKYSKNLCLMECRARYAFKLCGCVPHFYALKSIRRRVSSAPICTILGLNCLTAHTQIFKELTRNSELPFRCKCLPRCGALIVKSKIKRIATDKKSNRILSYLLQNPFWSLQRFPMFSGADLAVTIGNFLSVFLGFHLLGGIEIIYFFTLRLYWYRRGYLGERQ